jgi:hypothetical protein
MTLRQLINEAATLGQQLPHGLDTAVKVWNLGQEPLAVAGISQASRLQIGTDDDRKGIIAYLTIRP